MVNSPINKVDRNHPAVRFAMKQLKLQCEKEGKYNCKDTRGNDFYAPTEADIEAAITTIDTENLLHLKHLEDYALPGKLVLTGQDSFYVFEITMHREKVRRTVNRRSIDSSKDPLAEMHKTIDSIKLEIEKRINAEAEKKRKAELEARRKKEEAEAAEEKKLVDAARRAVTCPDHDEAMAFNKTTREFKCLVPGCRKVARPVDKPPEDAELSVTSIVKNLEDAATMASNYSFNVPSAPIEVIRSPAGTVCLRQGSNVIDLDAAVNCTHDISVGVHPVVNTPLAAMRHVTGGTTKTIITLRIEV